MSKRSSDARSPPVVKSARLTGGLSDYDDGLGDGLSDAGLGDGLSDAGLGDGLSDAGLGDGLSDADLGDGSGAGSDPGGSGLDAEDDVACEWDACTERLRDTQALVEHVKQHKLATTCKWRGCLRDQPFRDSYNLRQHLEMHTGETVDCPECRKKITPCNLDRHLKTHDVSRPKDFICDVTSCTARFYTKAHLQAHQATHTNDRPFVCDLKGKSSHTVCGKKFKLSDKLQKHKREVHARTKSYVCRHQGCAAAFPSRDKLTKHEKRHSDEKRHSCTVCTAQFNTKDDLKQHERTHSDDRNYVCDFEDCGKSYKQSCALSHHKRCWHSGERPFKCSWLVLSDDGESTRQCGKTFKLPSLLQRHESIHKKDYSCPSCDVECTSPKTLSTHLKRQHPGAHCPCNKPAPAGSLCLYHSGSLRYRLRQTTVNQSLNRLIQQDPRWTFAWEVPVDGFRVDSLYTSTTRQYVVSTDEEQHKHESAEDFLDRTRVITSSLTESSKKPLVFLRVNPDGNNVHVPTSLGERVRKTHATMQWLDSLELDCGVSYVVFIAYDVVRPGVITRRAKELLQHKGVRPARDDDDLAGEEDDVVIILPPSISPTPEPTDGWDSSVASDLEWGTLRDLGAYSVPASERRRESVRYNLKLRSENTILNYLL